MSNWSRYITEFVSFLKIEKGLSANSVIAYENDVQKLMNYCISKKLKVKEVTYQHLKSFITELYDLGLSGRSQARIISGIKQFFTYLMLENLYQNEANGQRKPFPLKIKKNVLHTVFARRILYYIKQSLKIL